MAFSQKLNMAFEESFEIVPNKKAKSSVWNHFGFLKENDNENEQKSISVSLLLQFPQRECSLQQGI